MRADSRLEVFALRRSQIFGSAAAVLAIVGALLAGDTFPVRFARPAPPAAPESFSPAGLAFSPGPAPAAPRPRATPAEALAAAVEAAALGRPEELYVHFVQRSAAGAFYEAWRGQIPPGGTVLVALADQVNAGAENGHAVPVTVWISDPAGPVFGLQGQAQFAPARGGVQIKDAELAALPLQVRTWGEAARRLAAAHPAASGAQRSDRPFYGRFRFTTGQAHFAVDALTGRVEVE